MTARAKALPHTITVTVPIRFERHGGRKTVISPAPFAPAAPRPNNTIIKAIAKAYRWQRMIENGQYPSITELAKGENINLTYACRIFQLTLLGPEIVEAVLDGRGSGGLQLNDLLKLRSVLWSEQAPA